MEIIPVDVHHAPIHTPFVLLQIQQTVTETIILQYSDGDHMLYSKELHNNDIKLNRALLLQSDGTKNPYVYMQSSPTKVEAWLGHLIGSSSLSQHTSTEGELLNWSFFWLAKHATNKLASS